jgi:hypothetical protein
MGADCMHRLYLVASLILVILSSPAITATAAGDSRQTIVPLRITHDPGTDVNPAIMADSEGRILVAWKHYAPDYKTAQLYLAQSPEWTGSSLVALSPSPTVQEEISLKAEGKARLTLSQPSTLTQTIFEYQPVTKSLVRLIEQPLHHLLTSQVDIRGGLHSSWAQNTTIHYTYNFRNLTTTLVITSPTTVGELVLATDAQAIPHLAWSGKTSLEQTAGISYALAISGTQAVAVTHQGRSPHLAVGPSGRAHLCWLTNEGLYYATSQNWGIAQQVVTGSLPAESIALAVGPDEVAHLVWVQDKMLWYANSADWQYSRSPLFPAAGISGLCMAIDKIGRPHIAWSLMDAQGNAEIYYLGLVQTAPQLRIIYPQEGQVLTQDVQARAASNLLAGDILRVEFYLQVREANGQRQERDTLLSLGTDQDGRDGWGVPLHIATLDNALLYRVVAWGTDTRGQMTQAVGNWFRVKRKGEPWIWLRSPDAESSRFNAAVSVLAGSPDALLKRLDLFFTPLACLFGNQSNPAAYAFLPRSFYIGSYGPQKPEESLAVRWQPLPYESRHLPDGRYMPLVVATDRDGRRSYAYASCLSIDNTLSPTVTVTAPEGGAIIEGTLHVAARASALGGSVQRIDFYLERAQSLSSIRYRGQNYSLKTPDLVWLGSDTNGSDGWNVQASVDETWDGDAWYVRAVAFDDQGLSSSTHSAGTFAIIGRKRPYLRIIAPAPGSTLHSVQKVDLFAASGFQYLSQAYAYVEDAEGYLTFLGRMTESGAHWVYDWDTAELPDGTYNLVIIGYNSDGHKSITQCAQLGIENAIPPCFFVLPDSDAVLSGSASIRLQSTMDSLGVKNVRFYYQDEVGQLTLIGYGMQSGNAWGIVWDTATVLDGEYALVAALAHVDGSISRTSRRIHVRNTTMPISWQMPARNIPWRGSKQVAWQIENPARKPMSVTLEYSPDAGTHWMELFTSITTTESFLWRTEGYPDSTRALLRLTATDSAHYGQSTSDPFVVNNVSNVPSVTLLNPRQGTTYGGQLRIVWQAQDLDNDPLSIDLDYRHATGPWIVLAHQLSNTGAYLWKIKEMPPAGDYEIRVTASDPGGTTSSDAVKKINLVSNNPPVVRLFAPANSTHLKGETLILWQATDEDNDKLFIDLYYSDNAGQAWLPLAENLPNSGYYVWQVSYLPVGTQYRIRVVAHDSIFRTSTESDTVFTVGTYSPLDVTFLSPALESSVAGTQLIRWLASNSEHTPLLANLMVRATDQTEWQPLLIEAPNDGFYVWETSDYPDGSYELRLVVTDGESFGYAMLAQPITVSNQLNDPPHVALLTPQGGETWSGTREITWHAWDRDDAIITATLYLSPDGGEPWHKLATLDARTGRYLWDTRQALEGRDYRLRIAVSDTVTTTEDTTSGVFALVNHRNQLPHVFFTSPDASGRLLRGNTVNWTVEDAGSEECLQISLALSEDEGATWHDVATDLLGTNEYVLDTTLLKPGNTYYLRLRASSGEYQVQEITPAIKLARSSEQSPTLRIERPNGGEKWAGMQELRWQASDPIGQSLRMDIESSQDGGQTWQSVARGLRNEGTYAWDTTKNANGIYLLRFTVDNGQKRTTQNSEPFVLENTGQDAPVISVVRPRNAEVWSGTREIVWRTETQGMKLQTVSLAYSEDSGITWHTFAENVADTGSYIWDTTTIPNCDQVWLRVTVNNGRLSDYALSASPFSVLNPHAPRVTLLAPRGDELWAGKQSIVWFTAYEGRRLPEVTLEISVDEGQNWRVLAKELPPQGSYIWDTTTLAENSRVWVRATAFDGLQSAVYLTPQSVTIRGNRLLPSLPLYRP